MAKTRTSVELYPDGCRLVDVEVLASGRSADVQDVRVRSFVPSAPASQDPVAMAGILGRLREERKLSRNACVIVWGLRTVHQLLRLPPAQPVVLEPIARREARKEIAAIEAAGGPASVTIELGPEIQMGAHRKREVSLVAAAAADVQQRIQPLVDAGFVVQRVLTPAMALAALARTQRETHGTVAYVAVIGRATCFAIVRNGVLMFARELNWGHEQGSEVRGQRPEVRGQTPEVRGQTPEVRGQRPEVRGQKSEGGSQKSEVGSQKSEADKLETRLASELKRSILYFKQTFRAPVEAVALCGDMPNLRSLTLPLGEAVGLPVQVLDSLVGIDAAAVPQPAELFRSDVAALRMVIACGAERTAIGNLLPKTILENRAARQQIVRLVVSAAAGLFLTSGWYAVARSTAASQQSERTAIERELAILEPDAMRQAELRQAYTLTTARQSALAAFDSQGPRLARLLETIAASTPEEIVLTAVDVEADGAFWRVDVRGTAISRDPAVAQGALNALIDGLSDSPFAGAPVQTPSRRVVSSRGVSLAGTAGRETIPSGMTGVEFSMQIKVAK